MEHVEPNINQMCASATHIPILAAVLARTEGPVLELGVGHYSTPIIHFACKSKNRHAVSIDTSRSWIDFFAKVYASANHLFMGTENRLISFDLSTRQILTAMSWEVAFIDQQPEVDRKKCIEILRDRINYIIVHDAEPLATVYGWGNIFDTFPHKFYYDFYGNGTAVVSMTEDLSWLY